MLKLGRVTTGINTERMTPILSESEQVLKMANFCSIWPGGGGGHVIGQKFDLDRFFPNSQQT